MTPGKELGRDVCTWTIYKDPDAIPEAHYRTFGCTKGKTGDQYSHQA